MSLTFYIFIGLIILVAFFLVVIIMVQNPKGGGLSSSFGGSGTQQLGGVQKTTDFLDKATWGLATALLVFILLVNIPIFNSLGTSGSRVIDENATPVEQVDLPTTPQDNENTDTEDPQ